MNSAITISVHITHSQNLPTHQEIAVLVGALLTEALADDPSLLATARVVSGATISDRALPTIQPRRVNFGRG